MVTAGKKTDGKEQDVVGKEPDDNATVASERRQWNKTR